MSGFWFGGKMLIIDVDDTDANYRSVSHLELRPVARERERERERKEEGPTRDNHRTPDKTMQREEGCTMSTLLHADLTNPFAKTGSKTAAVEVHGEQATNATNACILDPSPHEHQCSIRAKTSLVNSNEALDVPLQTLCERVSKVIKTN